MKKALLVSTVVGVHIIVIGGVMLTPGCGVSSRARLGEGMPGEPNMPSSIGHIESSVIHAPITYVQPAPVKDWPSDTSTYVVGKGESLSVIARERGLRVADIVALNNIKDPNKVRAGQTLVLPGKDGKPVKVGSAAKVPVRKTLDIPAGATTYTVKKGDSLSVIAYKAGVNVSDLRVANGISGDKIFVNQKLVIPGGKSMSDPEGVVASAVVTKVDTVVVPDDLLIVEQSTITVAEPVIDKKATLAVAAPVQKVGNLDFREYVVNENDDDLYGVAMMWGVSVAKLQEINKLSDTKLSIGQKLMIPISE
ncbi:MAG: LysM peptidoglycan-binding domain-containing protein [Kiritimatiellae bacterium]|nr:LysM peptidoglycan-binding domain-containing protein [Kiritimatiellia bacterium]